MNACENVGLTADEDSSGGGENDNVSDGVVIANETDSSSGEVSFTGIAAGSDVLTEERGADVGLVTALNWNTDGGEMCNVAIVDGYSQGIDDGNAATSEIGIQEKVFERDIFVIVGWRRRSKDCVMGGRVVDGFLVIKILGGWGRR